MRELNGHYLGRNLSGYTSFSFDISDVVKYGGVNVVAVFVDATECEGWWYEGGGIYRDVRLIKTDRLGNKLVMTKSAEVTNKYAYSISDESEKVVFEIDEDRTISVPKLKADSDEIKVVKGAEINFGTHNQKVIDCNLYAEINMFIAYGQSWAQGYDSPAISITQEYDSLMLDGGVENGVKNQDIADTAVYGTTFTPLVEKNGWHTWENGNQQSTGETPTYGQTAMIKQLLIEENGIGISDVSYQMYGMSPGRGSASLEMLAKGTDWFNRMVEEVRRGFIAAAALGKSFKVQAFSWTQGASVSDDAHYYDLLETLRLDFENQVKQITGQTTPVRCITWQMFPTGTDPKRLYDRYVYASEKYENIICSGATYHLDQISSTNIHFNSISQAWNGAYYGLVYKRSILDGEKFIPLKPIAAEITTPTWLTLKFNVPQPPLKFDTERVAEVENYGFQIFDVKGVEKTIISVSISTLDKIKIITREPFVSTDKIVYGNVGGVSWGRLTGFRGNLRDSQGDYISYNRSDLNLPIHNFCVVFSKTIAELQSN